MPTHTCLYCGFTFESRRSDARFCSGACRTAAYRERDLPPEYQTVNRPWVPPAVTAEPPVPVAVTVAPPVAEVAVRPAAEVVKRAAVTAPVKRGRPLSKRAAGKLAAEVRELLATYGADAVRDEAIAAGLNLLPLPTREEVVDNLRATIAAGVTAAHLSPATDLVGDPAALYEALRQAAEIRDDRTLSRDVYLRSAYSSAAGWIGWAVFETGRGPAPHDYGGVAPPPPPPAPSGG